MSEETTEYLLEEQPNLAYVRLVGQESHDQEIPAAVLARTLAGLQRLVYVMASDKESKKLGQRFRVTDAIERDYQLMCKIPKPGSYVVPLTFGQPIQKQLTFENLIDQSNGGLEISRIFDQVESLFQSVAQGDFSSVKALFTDGSYAKRSLIEIRKLLPSADDSWQIGFSRSATTNGAMLEKESVKYIDEFLAFESPAEDTITITGELIRIDFDERKVVLRYPPTRATIECIYSEELEDTMIENRRQYVQVTGEFTMDGNGNPVKLTDITRIEPLDLSPLLLRELRSNKRRFIFKRPIELLPELEPENKQFLVIEYEKLGFFVYANTREGLVTELSSQISVLWDQYGDADDELLTPEAQTLKAALLEAVEVRHAA